MFSLLSWLSARRKVNPARAGFTTNQDEPQEAANNDL